MIHAEFYLKDEVLIGFSVKGHAGYADFGLDIVCASVTSAVELTANAITEILKVPATVGVFENEIRLSLPDCDNSSAVDFLKALRLHLELLSQDYKDHIRLTDLEV
ncbi:ribosomal-processing cysteine protease Prp [Paludicola sp. MB14-C6]|uniref:ribosomal-processing cysteine protease Prp n=1 Tax=Paludihabitans sp. MB14-C6 TaxID=3070656 RepID=UPI0027DE92F8|nr:ribosomal-processing cysteine protease Prp [Paludicola sp. MB14-C6]WMJ23063.1 ribosomal-processing cysteine protease Prp [Paludicola sp. MB14-C6]